MKAKRLLPLLILVLSATITEASDLVRIEIGIFQIQTDISGEMSLTDYVWPSKSEEEKAKENNITLFTLAKLRLNDEEIVLNEQTWNLDPSGVKGYSMISNPCVMVGLDQKFAINIGSEETDYLEAREDGLYELKKLPETTGLTVKGRVMIEEPERILLKDLTFLFRTIEGREELKGSKSGQFGKPIVKERNLTTTLNLKPQTNYGILLSSEGQGALLIRLNVKRLTPQD